MHILGVQPGHIELVLDLSPHVASALPQIVQAARSIIAEFGRPEEAIAQPEGSASGPKPGE